MVRRLNELYKASVVSCQGLSLRLQRFFLDKQRLLDRIHSITAERLIFSHAVQMVRTDRHQWGRGQELPGRLSALGGDLDAHSLVRLWGVSLLEVLK